MSFDYSYHYKKWHKDTPEHQAQLIAYYSSLLGHHFHPDRSARILDVGCGMGYALLTLKHLGYQNVEGIDSDASQVQSSQAKGLHVQQTADSRSFLLGQAGQYDQVLALDLLEHIPHGEQIDFVAALAAALKPGGRLICTVPNANSALAARYHFIDWTHQCSFTEHSLDFLLYTGGFRNIRILPHEKIARPKLWWLPVGLSRHYWALRLVRGWRRLEMMAELGPEAGRAVPLSLNLLGLASKP